MKLRKILAGALSLAVAISTPSMLCTIAALSPAVSANAGITDYEEVIVDGSTFAVYEDHVELKYLPDNYKGEYSIPETVNGLTVTTTWASAFISQPELTSIHVPATITDFINSGTFRGTDNLKSFTVDENNPEYCAVDGVMYTKDMKTIYALPTADLPKEYSVPDNVEIIGSNVFVGYPFESVIIPDSVIEIEMLAFRDMVNLKSVRMSDSLKEIGPFAFSRDSVLESVDIPASVTYIGRNAFEKCTSLTSVTINNPECTIYDYDSDMTLGVKDTTVIHGYPDSTAQAYAEKYGFTFEAINGSPAETALGDPNNDGKADAKDASLILVAYAKASTGSEDGLTDEQRSAANVNGDDKVDAKDASAILSYYAYTSTGGTDTIEKFLNK